MVKYSKAVAFILARGGSKRLPGKNVMELGGKPLIQYSIDVAAKSSKIHDVVISTDCDDIIHLLSPKGDCKCIKRPAHLATDAATSEAALQHAATWYESNVADFDIAVLLQPTSPFTNEKMIEACIKLLEEFDSSMTVVQPNLKAQWFGHIQSNGGFTNLFDNLESEKFSKLSQFVPSGNVYAVRKDFLKRTGHLKNTSKHGACIVAPQDAVDIDYQHDFDYAQFLMRREKVENLK